MKEIWSIEIHLNDSFDNQIHFNENISLSGIIQPYFLEHTDNSKASYLAISLN